MLLKVKTKNIQTVSYKWCAFPSFTCCDIWALPLQNVDATQFSLFRGNTFNNS